MACLSTFRHPRKVNFDEVINPGNYKGKGLKERIFVEVVKKQSAGRIQGATFYFFIWDVNFSSRFIRAFISKKMH